MDYQYALNTMMKREQLEISDVAANTGWSIKYAQEIAANRRWHPYFDSVLKLCYRLRFNVFTFFEFAEAGVRGQHPTPNTQHPTPNTQHPTPNTQHPTPNTQHPTPNTQHPRFKIKIRIQIPGFNSIESVSRL
jgi:hypothetical protein